MTITINKKFFLDDILIKFPLFGKYNLKNLILLCLVFMCVVIHCNNFVFAAIEVPYRCVDERFGSDSCASLGNSTEVCSEWVYDDPHSFVAEFQLACQDWKRTLVGTISALGYMVSLAVFGPLSDRIGRKKVIVINCIFCAVFGIAKSFAAYYWIYIILEFLQSVLGNSGLAAFVLCIEFASNDKRVIYSMIVHLGYAAGFAVLPLVAWCIPYWRHMLLVIYTPSLLFIVYIFLLDESPRWLLSKGYTDKAIAIIEKMTKSCNLELKDIEFNNVIEEKTKRVKYTQLLKATLRSKTLSKTFFICITWWIAAIFVNYGLQINSVSLKGNRYVNFSLLAITMTLGNIISAFLLLYYKRKTPLICSFLLAGLLCVLQPFAPKELPWLSILLYMSGKFMSEVVFVITYMYTSELFPTYTRNSMHGLCSSIGRIGSLIAPQTPLLIVYWYGLPSLLFGIVSFVAGLVTLLAPNTANETLPDTIDEAEAIGNNQFPFKVNKILKLGRRSQNLREDSENNEHRF